MCNDGWNIDHRWWAKFVLLRSANIKKLIFLMVFNNFSDLDQCLFPHTNFETGIYDSPTLKLKHSLFGDEIFCLAHLIDRFYEEPFRAWWKGLPADDRKKGSRRRRPSTRQLFSRSTSTRQLFSTGRRPFYNPFHHARKRDFLSQEKISPCSRFLTNVNNEDFSFKFWCLGCQSQNCDWSLWQGLPVDW